MSTIKSSTEHLTLNADGSGKDIKFQANGVEKASISSTGAFTSTSIDATKLSGALPAISGSALTGVGKLLNIYNVICSTPVQTTSTSGIDIAESITLTPTSSGSRFLLTAIVHHYTNSTTTAWAAAKYNFKRDAVILRDTDSFGSGKIAAVGTKTMMMVPIEYLDSPNTAASITYKIQVRTMAGVSQFFNNYAQGSFTIYEIGA